MAEPWPVALIVLQVFASAVAHIDVVIAIQRQGRGRGVRRFAAALHILAIVFQQAAARQIFAVMRAGKGGRVRPGGLIYRFKAIALDQVFAGDHIALVGVQVQFAKYRGGIALGGDGARPQVGLGRECAGGVIPRAGGVGIFACHHADARRHAQGSDGGAIGKTNALARQCVQIGRGARPARAGERVRAELIGHDP